MFAPESRVEKYECGVPLGQVSLAATRKTVMIPLPMKKAAEAAFFGSQSRASRFFYRLTDHAR
jgi:hypothetical protein